MHSNKGNATLDWHPDGYLEIIFQGVVAPEPLQRLLDRVVLMLGNADRRVNILLDGRHGRISRQPSSTQALRKLRHQPNLSQLIILTTTDPENPHAIHGPSEITSYLTMSLGYGPIYTPDETEARRLAAA